MDVKVTPLQPTRSELKEYVKWGIELYAGNPCYVPPLIFDEVNTLDPRKNPAYEYCRAQSFMARDARGKPVGRITAIINDKLNEMHGTRTARFGFVDFVDDPEVVDALFAAAEQWARERGMDTMVGPMGFTDMDHEAMLVEGFDEMGTMATIYNYPYYPRHMERMGYVKDADWVEYRIKVPDRVPDKMTRVAGIVEKKFGLRNLKYTSAKKIKADYGEALFKLINEAYSELYGYCPLSDRQIKYYIDMYLSMLRLDYLSVIVDREGRLVGVGISIPSLSAALRKCRGRLWPLGWLRMLRAIRGYNPVIDLMLVAIKPEYQSKGVNAMLFNDLLPLYIKNGIQFAETNLELEDNANVQNQWEYFERRQHRRRRVFTKAIGDGRK